MSDAGEVRVTPDWLALREPADAAARAVELVDRLRALLPTRGPLVVHDLGCGTAGMARWLGPLLPGPQHWVLHDRDADLLPVAVAGLPGTAADGSPVTGEARQGDITRLDPRGLAGADLLTASALLDMLTADELDRLVAACAAAGVPVLVTGSVVGRVELDPADPLDRPVQDAFNDHQRRTAGGRRLLGPDAVRAAARAFTRLGAEVVTRPGPWRLGPEQGPLAAEWLTGWVGAAVELRPGLAGPAADYVRRRLAEAAAGTLAVTVHHQDLLVVPRRPGGDLRAAR